MGAPLTEVDTFTAAVPSIDDGDTASGPVFTSPVQALANRTKYLKARIETDGVKKRYRVATLAALKALTGLADGDVVVVLASNVEYIYRAAASDVSDGSFIVTPDAPTTGRFLALTLYGAVELDVFHAPRSSLLPRNGTLDRKYAETLSGTSDFTGAPNYFGPDFQMTLKAGDEVMLRRATGEEIAEQRLSGLPESLVGYVDAEPTFTGETFTRRFVDVATQGAA